MATRKRKKCGRYENHKHTHEDSLNVLLRVHITEQRHLGNIRKIWNI
jgi:hypothetical protein